MAKYTKEELAKRVDELELADNVKVSLMEDIYDSLESGESEELTSLKNELSIKSSEYDDLMKKYKERFFESSDKEVDEEEKIEVDEEVVDIKEI